MSMKKNGVLLGRLKDALESEADKGAAVERASMEAMMRTQARELRTLGEDARAELFAEYEAEAGARDRKLIAAHPLRPAKTDTILAGASTPSKPSSVNPVAGSSASDGAPDEA